MYKKGNKNHIKRNIIDTLNFIFAKPQVNMETYYGRDFLSSAEFINKEKYIVGEYIQPGEYILVGESKEYPTYELTRRRRIKEEYNVFGLGYTYVCLFEKDIIDIKYGKMTLVSNVIPKFARIVYPDNNRVYRVGTDIEAGSYLIEAKNVNEKELTFNHIVYVMSSFPQSRQTVYDISDGIFSVEDGEYVKVAAGCIRYLFLEEVNKQKKLIEEKHHKEIGEIRRSGLIFDDTEGSPIYHIVDNRTMIEGVRKRGHYYESDISLGTFSVTFNNGNIVTYDNVRKVQYGFINNKKYSCYTNVKWKTFSEQEFSSIDLYIFQLRPIDIRKIGKDKDHEFDNDLYIYRGDELIRKIESISMNIVTISNQTFCYTIEDKYKEKYYHHYLYRNNEILEICDNGYFSLSETIGEFRTNWLQNEMNKMLISDGEIRIFYHLDFSKKNCVLHEFCNSNARIEKYETILDDDYSINYSATFNIDDIDSLMFVAYCMDNSDFACFAIYNQPISKLLVGLPDIRWSFIERKWTYTIEERDYSYEIIKRICASSNDENGNAELPSLFNRVSLMSARTQYEMLIDYIGLKLGQKANSRYKAKDMKIDAEKRNYYFSNYYNTIFEKLSIQFMSEYQDSLLNGKLNVTWKSEFTLFTMVSLIFKDALYQYHVEWLGLQSLDIYIPSYRIAFEYQGKQHYEAIDFFGGEEAFEYRVKLDKKKRELCAKNNVQLIEWKYDEMISNSVLLKKLQEIDISIEDIRECYSIADDINDTIITDSWNGNNIIRKRKVQIPKIQTDIYQYDTNGNLLKKYNTISEASRDVGISSTSILKVINGTRKTAAGYVWKRLPGVEEE